MLVYIRAQGDQMITISITGNIGNEMLLSNNSNEKKILSEFKTVSDLYRRGILIETMFRETDCFRCRDALRIN